jgi:chaperonin GroES
MENVELAKPIGDKVLVEIEKVEKTVGGIILPETAQFGDNKVGKVVSVGAGIYTNNGVRIPMQVEVGDKVLLPHNSYDTQKVKFNNTEYVLLREGELLMVIR